MSKLNDLTGQKFNKLTVLYRIFPNTKSGNARWHCICDCGNECDVVGTNLKSGHTKSCGCNIKIHMAEVGKQQGFNNIENLNGLKFNYLTVLDRIYMPELHTYKCLCQCDCGNKVLVSADKLKSGHTKSCGCINSYGEKYISNYLTKHNYSFLSQQTFTDLVNPQTNSKLRFDFGVYDTNQNLICLIEYNGKQHYDKSSLWYTEEGKYRDQLKIIYCKEKNIPLYIIRYDQNTENELNAIFSKYNQEYKDEV